VPDASDRSAVPGECRTRRRASLQRPSGSLREVALYSPLVTLFSSDAPIQ